MPIASARRPHRPAHRPVLATLAAAAFALTLPATDYYVSSSGDDSNPGTSRAQAWRTVYRVTLQNLQPGDRVLFEAGTVFSGSLYLAPEDAGTATAPVVITSYGGGRATLDAGTSFGIYAYRCGGIEIRSLDVRGSGAATNTSDGVAFFTDDAGGGKLDHLRISDVAVSGFGIRGISVASWDISAPGYRDVRIERTDVFDNGHAGLQVWGAWHPATGRWAHRDIYIAQCNAYRNTGIAGLQQPTGSGIVVSEADGVVIESCRAHHNGAQNLWSGGGPVGIWAWHANDVTIQLCISDHNRTGSLADGGGFGLDGGVTNSRLQYNYSYDNDGPGYLLAQFPSAPTHAGNVVRYNASHDDARKNGAGAIALWCSAGSGLHHDEIYANTVSLAPAANGQPAAVFLGGLAVHDIGLRNNLLITGGGLPLVVGQSFPSLQLQGNDYWPSGAPFAIQWDNRHHADLPSWRAASGQETLAGSPVGLSVDPGVAGGSPQTITTPALRHTLTALRLDERSSLADAGLDLRGLFGIDPGPHDYALRNVPLGSGVDVGAFEATDNLVANPGFEFDNSCWAMLGNARVATAGAAFGNRALELGPGAAVGLQVVRGLVPGHHYRVSAWGRNGSPGAPGLIGLTFVDPLGKPVAQEFVQHRSAEYALMSLDAVAPARFDAAWLWFLQSSPTGSFRIDGCGLR